MANMMRRADLHGEMRSAEVMVAELIRTVRTRQFAGALLAACVGGFVGGVVAPVSGSVAVALIVAWVLGAVVLVWLPSALIPVGDRAALAVVLPNAIKGYKEWRRLSSGERPPRTSGQRRQWMAEHPVILTDRGSVAFHVSLLIQDGDYETARHLAEEISTETPRWAFERALRIAEVDFESGLPGDLSEARRSLSLISSPRDVDYADSDLAFEEARRGFLIGQDWRSTLVARSRADVGRGLRDVLSLGLTQLMVSPALVLGWLAAMIAVSVVAITLGPH